MKAMLLTAPGELVRDDVARPGPDQGHLLVRVTHSGICGTDYKIFNGSIPVQYPRIMGHEMAGEVVDPGSSELRGGDRIIVHTRKLVESREVRAGEILGSGCGIGAADRLLGWVITGPARDDCL